MEVAPGGPSGASGAGDQLTSCDRLPVRHQPTTIDDVRAGRLDAVSVVENDEVAGAAVHTGKADRATGRSIDGHRASAREINTVMESSIPQNRVNTVASGTDQPTWGGRPGWAHDQSTRVKECRAHGHMWLGMTQGSRSAAR